LTNTSKNRHLGTHLSYPRSAWVRTASRSAAVIVDAERPGVRSHAERGNEPDLSPRMEPTSPKPPFVYPFSVCFAFEMDQKEGIGRCSAASIVQRWGVVVLSPLSVDFYDQRTDGFKVIQSNNRVQKRLALDSCT